MAQNKSLFITSIFLLFSIVTFGQSDIESLSWESMVYFEGWGEVEQEGTVY